MGNTVLRTDVRRTAKLLERENATSKMLMVMGDRVDVKVSAHASDRYVVLTASDPAYDVLKRGLNHSLLQIRTDLQSVKELED